MLIPFLISKIHHAAVSATDINYEGSISIDEAIMEKANLKVFQKVEVYNTSNGSRFATYVIPHRRSSREIIVNGAAARLAAPGDRIIIAAYALIDEGEIESLNAVILHMTAANEIEKIINGKL